MNIYLSPSTRQYWISSQRYFSMQQEEKFMNYFFSFLSSYHFCSKEGDINVYSIQATHIPPSKGINVILCVENCSYWKHYKHYNKYSCFGDSNVSIYLYNHIDRCHFQDNYIAIPIIYLQLDYFEKYYQTITPTKIVPFHQKKFCCIATSENNFKAPMIQFLKSIGDCDFISKNKFLKNKSCYHSIELLNYFNQYKFVFVCENSVKDGYITEKIFNCFFARVIPIYYGSRAIHRYFLKDSFLCFNRPDYKTLKNKILKLKENKKNYLEMINCSKTNTIDKEDYQNKIMEFIKKKDK